jgi:hypothetical protein
MRDGWNRADGGRLPDGSLYIGHHTGRNTPPKNKSRKFHGMLQGMYRSFLVVVVVSSPLHHHHHHHHHHYQFLLQPLRKKKRKGEKESSQSCAFMHHFHHRFWPMI